MNVLYLIGGPATGKSTLMAHLTHGAARTPHVRVPIPHETLLYPGQDTPRTAELGVRRPSFPGTDTLSMSINPTATASLSDNTWDGIHTLLGEGDRLANRTFLAAAHAHHRLHVVFLRADPTVTAARCSQRGSTQSSTWIRGRTTKAERLASRLDAAGVRVQELNADNPTPVLAAQVQSVFGRLEEL